MRHWKIYWVIAIATILNGCFLFSSKGELLYENGRYSIRKKNLVSYYQASPDLFVHTADREIKINLNAFGERRIPQEKIAGITINEINADSVMIHFTTADSTALIKEEYISINITKAIDSIAAQTH
jgi:hypothetical protein